MFINIFVLVTQPKSWQVLAAFENLCTKEFIDGDVVSHKVGYFDINHMTLTKKNSALLSMMKDSYIRSFNSVSFCPVAGYDSCEVKPSNSQLGVFAVRNLPANTVIDGVVRFLAKVKLQDITPEIEFSIFQATARSSQNTLMLGPLSFLNHACTPNVRWEATSRGCGDTKCLQARTLRTIEADEELFVSYGDEYFGEGNKDCLCKFCTAKNSSVKES